MKRRIVVYRDEHPLATLQTVATVIQQEFNLRSTPGISTMSEVLNNADRWRNVQGSGNQTRHDVGTHPKLEDATVMWMNDKVGFDD
jgi:hypothetical protein